MPAEWSGQARDLYEAVGAVLDAEGSAYVMREAMRTLRQQYRLACPIPNEDEGSALYRIVSHLFDDVARHAEVDEQIVGQPVVPLARFADLTPESQHMLASSMRGVLAQMATIARNKAPK